jgi:environmental stress-induced protein Ves
VSSVIVPSAWRRQPWKSGAGITNEIVRWPEDAEDYEVRVSVAEVAQPGPFSSFPGYRRWSVLLAGGPIELLTPDVAYLLDTVGDLVELDGTTAVTAVVPDGPVHLLNVLGKPGTRVGIGASRGPVRFAFAVAATGELDRWHARVLDPAAPVDDPMTVWIA